MASSIISVLFSNSVINFFTFFTPVLASLVGTAGLENASVAFNNTYPAFTFGEQLALLETNFNHGPALMIEFFLRNSSFFCLFLSMIFYWIQTAFSFPSLNVLKSRRGVSTSTLLPVPSSIVGNQEANKISSFASETPPEHGLLPLLGPKHMKYTTLLRCQRGAEPLFIREGEGVAYPTASSFQQQGVLFDVLGSLSFPSYASHTSKTEEQSRGEKNDKEREWNEKIEQNLVSSAAARPLNVSPNSNRLDAPVFLISFFEKLKQVPHFAGTALMIISNFLLMFLLIFRWKESGHFPLSNLYESLMFLSWSCTFIHLVLEFKTNLIRSDAILLKRCLGSITSPIALFTNAFATFNLPTEMQKASPLVPALQSNWLMMHVTVMIISYSALILGSLLSIAFLILISSFSFSVFNFSFLIVNKKKVNQASIKVGNFVVVGVPPATNPYNVVVKGGGLVPSEGVAFQLPVKQSSFGTPYAPIQPSVVVQGGNQGAEEMGKDSKQQGQKQEPFGWLLASLAALTTTLLLPSPKGNNVVGKETEQPLLLGYPSEGGTKPLVNRKKQGNNPYTKGDGVNSLPMQGERTKAKMTLAWNFDNLSYRVLGIGFPFLTIGILSGAVWANEAWGSYWSWDPKETWALLTWLIFAIYLHARITKGWQGKKPAIIASFGFLAIWICFLGVNLIGEGLHSYGWFSNS